MRRLTDLAPATWAVHTEKMFRLLLALPLALTACSGDETISAFVDKEATYRLTEVDGKPYPSLATVSFPDEGSISGRAPCNSFSGQLAAPYPWFELGPMRVTRSTCPEMAAERSFFKDLAKMTLIETNGDVLILRDDGAREMIFVKTETDEQ